MSLEIWEKVFIGISLHCKRPNDCNHFIELCLWVGLNLEIRCFNALAVNHDFTADLVNAVATGVWGCTGAISFKACSIAANCWMKPTLNCKARSPVRLMASKEKPSRFIRNMGCVCPRPSRYVISWNHDFAAKFWAAKLRIDFKTFLCILPNTCAIVDECVRLPCINDTSGIKL